MGKEFKDATAFCGTNCWQLVLVGPFTRQIKEYASKLILVNATLQERIHFIGNIWDRKQLDSYYQKATIFVLPSRWESFGIVLIEAMHQADFPIVTDCCDAFPDLIDKGKYGDIIPNEDKDALVEALRTRMQSKEDTVEKGIGAKAFVDEQYDWRQVAKTLDGYLEEIQ